MEKNDNNVIKFSKRKSKISDAEINSLFLGFVKLIKKSAEESIENDLKRECSFATQRVLELTKQVADFEKKVLMLLEINKTLNKKIKVQREQIRKNIACKIQTNNI